ncbi:MAG: STAS domain-containing protein [Firmicutes bacterium]|nr:STAS domain-containing protein [Bacillota bacterium]
MQPGTQINSNPVTEKINVVTVEGEVDVFNAPSVSNYVVELIEKGYFYIIINLDGVKYIDSIGLSKLIELRKILAEKKGALSLVCCNPKILKLFYLTNLVDLFVIHHTEDVAINKFLGAY